MLKGEVIPMVAPMTTPTARRSGQGPNHQSAIIRSMGMKPETARALAQEFEKERKKQGKEFYKQAVKGLPDAPEAIVVYRDGTIRASVNDIAEIVGRSQTRVKGWVSEKKVDATKPGGHDLFVSLAPAFSYIADVAEGKRRGGRPPKSAE